ncbi:PREDICTED: synaptotagmin-3 [Prunus dulcis]|uniref:PREDICTED: synaptotagmin-3 n=1 Tax=Prunus dulcis TaxID=3755 RepID=A0A5E4E8V3_PRUDU|nr:synaptotagmin-3 [Prunus dulcis]VVA12227.1 PREDICTED: synaptotagmin-3 [Prunus dulcis]
MGFLSSLLGIFGFGIGIPLGLLVGFFLFIYSKPKEVEDPVSRPLYELDELSLQDLLPEIPLWVKNPNYHSVDWLNKFISDLWPYLDKEIGGMIRSVAQPIFSEYIGKFQIESIEFEKINLGTLPPIFYGLQVYETNEKELILEPSIKWAGNPNIILVVKVLSVPIAVQLVDLQVFLAPRIALKPLVPAFPCFANIVVSLMEKPHVDFGMKILGGDIMSIPGLYHFVQETIKKQVASLYLWPQTLEIPVLDISTVAVKKPVGILHVNVVRATKLLRKDILGSSDPYVKLSLTGDGLPAKKTSIKMKNLNPEWNEKFKLIVKDPKAQVLQLQVYDWDKVGGHDRIGMQLVPLKQLTPHEMKEFKLDLLKDTNITDSHSKKQRGQLVVELTFVPFKEDTSKYSGKFSGPIEAYRRHESEIDMSMSSDEGTLGGSGVLSVMIQGAEDVEGKCHNNPYALLLFRGEKKKTHMLRKTRDPRWNEEFQFMLDEPPLDQKVHIEVLSKRTGISFRLKESLGHVEINLRDVVHNGRINQKYHLINSKNGMIHVEISWKMI